MDHLLKFFGFLLILQTANAHGCATDYIAFGGVNGCFQIFNEVGRTWFNARDKCEDEGLQLVEPTSSDDAINLRNALLDTYGTGTFWLGAKADGTEYVWEYDHTTLSKNSPLWIPGLNKKDSDGQCLTLSVNTDSFNNYPDRPYGIGSCSAANTKYATICEAVCPGGCGNGQCTSSKKCSCNEGYTGPNCKTKLKPKCSTVTVTSTLDITTVVTVPITYTVTVPPTEPPIICPTTIVTEIITPTYFQTTCNPVTVTPTEVICATTTVTTIITPGFVCPEGFFKIPESPNQCLKYFTDSERTWDESRSKCHAEGLFLAKPEEPNALRRFIVENFEEEWSWIGARGTGSSIDWVRDGTTLSSTDSAWMITENLSRTSTIHCLRLLSSPNWINYYPKKPYGMGPCDEAGRYALCELVM